LVSLNFADLLALASTGNDAAHCEMYCGAARQLEQAGADFVLICSNTGHRRFDAVSQAVGLPVLHIADSAAAAIRAANLKRIGLLGTAATMSGTFITGRLVKYGIEIDVPEAASRAELDGLIINEMACGVFSERARKFAAAVIKDMTVGEKVEGI